jgi:hypothetical protein
MAEVPEAVEVVVAEWAALAVDDGVADNETVVVGELDVVDVDKAELEELLVEETDAVVEPETDDVEDEHADIVEVPVDENDRMAEAEAVEHEECDPLAETVEVSDVLVECDPLAEKVGDSEVLDDDVGMDVDVNDGEGEGMTLRA